MGRRCLRSVPTTTAEITSFAPQHGRVLILNLGFDSKDSIPSELTHRFQVSGADPFNKQPEQFDPPVLAPPLEGPGWLASDGSRGQTGQINSLVGLLKLGMSASCRSVFAIVPSESVVRELHAHCRCGTAVLLNS